MIKTIETLPYEICDAFQDFLERNTDYETFLNTIGYTNNTSTETLKQVKYVHYPTHKLAIETFPFVSFEALESNDDRQEEDGFSWDVDIVIGLEDIDVNDIDQIDNQKTISDNVTKYTVSRTIQDFGKQIIKAIGEEIEVTGIKGDFEIEFGRISQMTTPTGEFNSVYHLIELKLISYKEI